MATPRVASRPAGGRRGRSPAPLRADRSPPLHTPSRWGGNGSRWVGRPGPSGTRGSPRAASGTKPGDGWRSRASRQVRRRRTPVRARWTTSPVGPVGPLDAVRRTRVGPTRRLLDCSAHCHLQFIEIERRPRGAAAHQVCPDREFSRTIGHDRPHPSPQQIPLRRRSRPSGSPRRRLRDGTSPASPGNSPTRARTCLFL